MTTLVAYISGHGFGHASRTLALVTALAHQAPAVRIVIRSAIPPWLVARTAPGTVVLEPLVCDTGAVQHGSLQLDPVETIRAATRFMATWPARVATEVAALRAHSAALVLTDIPPLGVAAAEAAGIPAVALGNFTWDWIYAGYPGGGPLAERIGAIYARTTLALRLPLWGGFSTCPRIEDLPFIARGSRRDPGEVRAAFGWPLDERLVLLSFGGFALDGLDLDALAGLDGYRILLPNLAAPGPDHRVSREARGSLLPLDEAEMYARGFRYEDIVGAVDVVVSKPGYGIISECLANGTALLYTSRGDFAEYPVLVAGLPRLLRAGYVDHGTLFSGRWQAPLDALLAQPAPPDRPRVDGAEVAAGRLLDMM